MTKNLIIREARLDDVLAIQNLMVQLGFSLEFSYITANLQEYLHNSHMAVFVAELNNEIVACVSVVLLSTLHQELKLARVNELVVDDKWRSQQIGEKLLKYAENYAKANKCVKIELLSGLHREKTGAHKFYQRQAYLDNATKYFVKELG